MVPSLGVQPTWTNLRDGAVRLFVPAYFLSSVVLDWRDGEGLWLAVMLLLGVASFVDFVWPEGPTMPKPIKLSKIAICLVAVALFAGGGWRHFARTSIVEKGKVIATMLKRNACPRRSRTDPDVDHQREGFQLNNGIKAEFWA